MLVKKKSLDEFENKLLKDGYFIFRQAFNKSEMQKMIGRLEKIISGEISIAGRRFQEETKSGLYEEVEKIKLGYKGPDAFYRKISDLEYDYLFLKMIQSEWIRLICEKFVGEKTSIMRMTMMDKPPQRGTILPWHQDVSKSWPTLTQPKLAIWFCLDKTSPETGSLEILPGSHHNGVIGNGHMISDDNAKKFSNSQKLIIESDPGDVVFFNTKLLHRSGVNKTTNHRRAINVILLPGEVMHLKSKNFYPVLFGDKELIPEKVKNHKKIPNLNINEY